MSRHLVLLRHGQTEFNAARRMQGQLDTDLSERGRRQAASAARVLGARKPRLILASDLRRAVDTASALADVTQLPVVHDPRLRETSLGEWEGQTHDEVEESHPGARAHWRGDADWAPPGGESRREVADRGVAALAEHLPQVSEWGSDDRPVIVVAHGGVLGGIAARLLGLPMSHYPMLTNLGNVSWGQLTFLDEEEVPASVRETARSEAWHKHIDPVEATLGRWRLDVWNATGDLGHDAL